ncbi:hypothetical protein BN173_1870008 [Clostridioides difficile T11]|nr:hypothetical protein BN173_1870008 [Clostridioides difficile T11]CCL30107.1 hypothetical protein BN174_1780008 [Clostridioides difficile E15]
MSKLSSHFFSDFVDNTYLHIFLLVVVVQIVVNHATDLAFSASDA